MTHQKAGCEGVSATGEADFRIVLTTIIAAMTAFMERNSGRKVCLSER